MRAAHARVTVRLRLSAAIQGERQTRRPRPRLPAFAAEALDGRRVVLRGAAPERGQGHDRATAWVARGQADGALAQVHPEQPVTAGGLWAVPRPACWSSCGMVSSAFDSPSADGAWTSKLMRLVLGRCPRSRARRSHPPFRSAAVWPVPRKSAGRATSASSAAVVDDRVGLGVGDRRVADAAVPAHGADPRLGPQGRRVERHAGRHLGGHGRPPPLHEALVDGQHLALGGAAPG